MYTLRALESPAISAYNKAKTRAIPSCWLRKIWTHGSIETGDAYDGDSDIGRLMHDFRCCDAKDMYFKEMKEITHHFKETEEGVEYMCRAFEETRMEGELRGRIDTALRLIEMGKLSLEDIAEACGLPLEKVQELAGAKTA